MALGGGTFTSQNKVLPGAYINFVSAALASSELSDRGIATIPFELDWGEENKVIKVTKAEAIKYARKIFGYAYTDDKLSAIRDVFKNATVLYTYRLNGGGTKASNTYATALYGGTRGNDIKIVIQANVDESSKYDVKTYLGDVLVDEQTVASAAELKVNDFVTFKTDASLSVTAGTALSGGTNKTVTGAEHSAYLAAIEPYSYNCMGVVTDDSTTKALYTAFAKRMRNEVGVKFQVVLYNQSADEEGVINVKNCKEVIPWTVGAEAGCPVNKSCTNKVYDGEAVVPADYTQAQLTEAIEAGEFVFHKVGDEIRILTDINSLKTTTEDKGEVFKSNQSIRVMDQIANDIAVLFNTKYLGSIQNNESGRVSLWGDIVKHHKELNNIGAIENFKEGDIVVSQGTDKKSVVVSDVVTIVNSMEQLYMTVTVQ